MIGIYLCDDEETIRRQINTALERKILIENYDMKVLCSAAGAQELLDAIEDGKQGVYFLDVELKGEAMDGFALGQAIRRLDSRGFIIYVTAFADLAFETFRYHLEALDYIVKGEPARMQEGIRHCLEVITERMCEEREGERSYFTVKVMDVVKHIPVDEIMFFETMGRTHRIELHGKNDRMDFIGSMRDLEEEFGDRFLRVHRAYLVNVNQVAQLDLKEREILMQNGERCLFSRKAKAALLARIT